MADAVLAGWEGALFASSPIADACIGANRKTAAMTNEDNRSALILMASRNAVRTDLQMDSSWSQFRALDVWGDVFGVAVKNANAAMNNEKPSARNGRLWVIPCIHPPDQLRVAPKKMANPTRRLMIP